MSCECYLCYDIKGIQQFIFSVPKLKYVVGASLLIDEFDRKAGEGEVFLARKRFLPGAARGPFTVVPSKLRKICAKNWSNGRMETALICALESTPN